MNYILDACALIAFLRGEQGCDYIESVLSSHSSCYVHVLNLCEVYYDCLRTSSSETANEMLGAISAHICVRYDVDDPFWKQAGHFKATYRRISLADCFALTLTKRLSGSLLTSDHHEFDALAQAKVCAIEFIR